MLAARRHAPPRPVALLGKALGPGALERIDRLLLVADGKDGAQCRPGAVTGEEILRQRLDDAPLDRARILRLVHENVIDALIQLVVNPGADILLGQKIGRAGDEVFEIELAASLLQLFVVAVQPVGENEGGPRRAVHPHQLQPVAAGNDMGARFGDGLCQGRGIRQHRLDEELAVGLRLAFGGQHGPF